MGKHMKQVELLIERVLLASRWILVVFYLGLALALVLYAINYVEKIFSIALHVFDKSEEDLLLAMLGLIDSALVAGLTVMVMIAGYENFVSHFDDKGSSSELSWMGKLDSGGLKLKVAAAIVAISSISLLQNFMHVDTLSERHLTWATIIHVVFVGSALLMGVLERIQHPPQVEHDGKSDHGSAAP